MHGDLSDPWGGRDPLDDLPNDTLPPKSKTSRLSRSPVPFVRVPISAVSDERFGIEPRTRLWLLLLHESRWGKREVELTAMLAAKAGLSRWTKSRLAHDLERRGLIRIKRNGHNSALKIAVIDPATLPRSDN
jgi:hypothetical protein